MKTPYMNPERVTKDLIHPKMSAEIQTLEHLEGIVDVKLEKQDESDGEKTFEFVECGSYLKTEIKIEENQHFMQENKTLAQCKQENILETEPSTEYSESTLSYMECEKRNRQLIVENDKEYFFCDDCGKTCDTKDILIKHIHVHKPVIGKQTNMLVTQNSVCNGKVTKNVSSKKDNTFKCHYCNRLYSRKDSLNIHMRTHTGEKPYKCPYCGCKFVQNTHLKMHIKIHTGEKPHKCPYCSYTCRGHYDLKRHIRTHTGEKPWECPYCSYTCTHSGILKTHIRIHTGENPYKCAYCRYACKRSSDLNRHVRTHTGEKPYICDICNMRFTNSYRLKVHTHVHMDKKTV